MTISEQQLSNLVRRQVPGCRDVTARCLFQFRVVRFEIGGELVSFCTHELDGLSESESRDFIHHRFATLQERA